MREVSEVDLSKTSKLFCIQVPKSKVEALPGMIGSLEEYASLVGTTVGKLQDSR